MGIGILRRYASYLPITSHTPALSLGEGETPLVKSDRLAALVGCEELHFKVEGCNPTGSFKDRGMVVTVAKASEGKSAAIICASTGNTSASAAAYGALTGLNTIIIVPKGNIALGKLAQAIAYGAKILAIDGNFDQALEIVRALVNKHPITVVNSINPYRIEGQKTAAFEIVDVLGDAPDYLFIPVGNAGNITAYWKGFVEYQNIGLSSKRPKMMGFEAAGAAPIVAGRKIDKPETIASAIRIGNPASWKGAESARDQSGGTIDVVTDDEILAAYRLMASKAGIFGEPASAASLAGLVKWSRSHDLSGQRVVCIVTGTGLKDPDTAMAGASSISELPPELARVEKSLGLV